MQNTRYRCKHLIFFFTPTIIFSIPLTVFILLAPPKSVSRLAKLIDDAKNRTARQNLPENFVSELGQNGNSSTEVTKKREVLLDALGNVPLKLYDVAFDNIDSIVKKSWTPQMHLTEEERKVVEAKGTVLLLGRSGTGKTVCICNRIEFDRQRLGHKPMFTQLFVARSSPLCVYVEGAVGSRPGSTFTTFDKLVRSLESSLSNERTGKIYHRQHHVDFSRFKREFYAELFPQEKISALIVWKAIRTFFKGSIEAFQSPTGQLSRDYFISGKLGKNRCKVPEHMRETIYDIFLQYQSWISEKHLWDDCKIHVFFLFLYTRGITHCINDISFHSGDRIVALLKGIEYTKKSDPSLYEEKIKRNKLYVDVRAMFVYFLFPQDSTHVMKSHFIGGSRLPSNGNPSIFLHWRRSRITFSGRRPCSKCSRGY